MADMTEEQQALYEAADLIDDLIGGNGIHWQNRIRALVIKLDELGYDMEQSIEAMDIEREFEE